MNNITDIEYVNNQIWASSTGGAFVLNPSDNSIIKYTNVNGLAALNLTAIEKDTSGNLYFGSSNGTISAYHYQYDLWTHYSEPAKEITDIYCDHDTMWVTTSNSIFIYLIKEKSIEFKEILTNFPVQPVKINRLIKFGHTIFCATQNGLLYAPSNYTILKDPAIWNYYSTINRLPSNMVNDLAIYHDTLFIATANGIIWQNKEDLWGNINGWENGAEKIVTNKEKIYLTRSNLYYQLAGNNWILKGTTANIISSGVIDHQGNLWLGLEDGGLMKEGWDKPFKMDGPASNYMGIVIKDRNNNLWMTSGRYRDYYSKGFYQYDFNQWTNYRFEGAYSRNNSSVALYEDSYGNIWIGNWGGGLTIISNNNFIFYHKIPGIGRFIISTSDETQVIDLPEIPADRNECLSGVPGDQTLAPLYAVIPGIIENNNIIWMINYLALEFNPIIAIPQLDSNGNIPPCSQWLYFGKNWNLTREETEIAAIEFDDYGRLWFATYHVGVRIIDFGANLNNTGDDYISSLTRDNYLFSNKVNCLKKDFDGYMWIGTEWGLNSYDGQTVWAHYGGMNEAGPIGNFINNIFVDANNNKWFATNKGLTVLLANTNIYEPSSWKHFTPENSGLPCEMINSVYVDEISGAAYIATDAGLAVYHSAYSEYKNDYKSLVCGPSPFILDGAAIFTIKNLMVNSTVKIFNISAELVKVLIPDGSRVYWNGRDKNNNLVPSGIYLYLAYTKDGTSEVGKFAVIRP